MGNNPSYFTNGFDYPVEQVSWNDAQDYCAKLTAGLSGELKGKMTFRLPSDAEWSLAVGLSGGDRQHTQRQEREDRKCSPVG